MNVFEEIKDIEGKTHLVFEKPKRDDEINNIGSKPDDFEIIKLLGAGTFGKVFKVISKLNNKVYAMKIINLQKLKDLKGKKRDIAIKLALNESKYLTVLCHPHIMKYYTNFRVEDNLEDNLYLIVENAENGDLHDFIESHRKMRRHIPEDELWSIFLQCMQGLTYIHEMGVIHRDIKPGNILMDNNMTIKLGDFGTCAVKKNKEDENINIEYINAEYEQILNDEKMQCHETFVGSGPYMAKEAREKDDEIRKYDQKVDVYSMGVTFYELCYLENPILSKYHDSVNYSKEMLDIIKEMMEEDKDKRKPSKYFLEKIQKEFSKRYNKNTSIDAIIRCLFPLDDITNYYTNLNPEQIKNKPITKAYIQCLKNFTEEYPELYFNSIRYFREIICTQNTKFDKTKEINPKLVLAFLIRQLHKEMKIIVSLTNKQNSYFITSGEEQAKTNKVEMLINFENKFFSQLNSFISQKMMGLTKTVNICDTCQMKTYLFNGYFFVSLDLEIISKFISPDVENYFAFRKQQYTKKEKYCSKCIMQTQHKEYKQFYTAPDYLIAIINRGKNDSCRLSVNLKQQIDLSSSIETQGKKYKLVGFINKNYESEKYLSFIEVKDLNSWFKCEGNQINENRPEENKDMFSDIKGELVMAFYEAIYN